MELAVITILVTVCTLLLSAVTYFVVKTFNRVDSHTDSIKEIDTNLKLQVSSCAKTHEYVNSQIKSLAEDVDEKIKNTKEHIEEVYSYVNSRFVTEKK
jgi:peptidoglycan hydrolase CwlO-like protein